MNEIKNRAFYDAGERTFTFVREQDVEDILERNKRLQNEPQKSDWGRHIASVPNVIWTKWLNEDFERGINWVTMSAAERTDYEKRLMKRKLADPEWAYLRTDK